MRIGVFSTKAYDRDFFDVVNQHHRHELIFFEPRLTTSTVTLAEDFFTRNAMENIALTTLTNIAEIERTGRCENMITP